MKKIKTAFILMFVLSSVSAWAGSARTAHGLTEAEQLGITAGIALACNAGEKLDDFELIASRIIANKSLTEKEEKNAYRSYASHKLRAYREQKKDPQITCGEALSSFNHLPIFRSIVYADGSIKMYDGSFLRPKRPVFKSKNRQVKRPTEGRTSYQNSTKRLGKGYSKKRNPSLKKMQKKPRNPKLMDQKGKVVSQYYHDRYSMN